MKISSVRKRLANLGIELPAAPVPKGAYAPCVRAGGLVFVSGQLPVRDGNLLFEGKVGGEVSVERGKQCARLAAVNSIAVLISELEGNPGKTGADGFVRIVKVVGYVALAEGFEEQAEVLNGASAFYTEVFGDSGRHARTAVGVCELPLRSPVEIELTAETAPEVFK